MHTNGLKIGVIGLGGMGRQHSKTCVSLPNVQLKAISDTSTDSLERGAKEYNLQETYQDGFEMIEHADLDAVIIALPNHLHAAFSIRAFEKGMHVYFNRYEPQIEVEINQDGVLTEKLKEEITLGIEKFREKWAEEQIS